MILSDWRARLSSNWRSLSTQHKTAMHGPAARSREAPTTACYGQGMADLVTMVWHGRLTDVSEVRPGRSIIIRSECRCQKGEGAASGFAMKSMGAERG